MTAFYLEVVKFRISFLKNQVENNFILYLYIHLQFMAFRDVETHLHARRDGHNSIAFNSYILNAVFCILDSVRLHYFQIVPALIYD